MLEKLKGRIEELEVRKQKILTELKEGKHISVEGVITVGKELELIRVKIWAIEEAIHG